IFREYDELIFKNFSEEEKIMLMDFLERLVGEMRKIEGIEGDFSNPMELCCLLSKKIENIDMRKEI
ncbi:MAG: hypothetical protein K2O36_00470, partial [Ruminococcus sp.]|nr:hypothetical protein [Ruminococcus sp.]